MALDEQIVNTRKEIEDLDRRITEVENLVLETENFRKRQFLISASCVLIILLILLSFAISMAGYFISYPKKELMGELTRNIKLSYTPAELTSLLARSRGILKNCEIGIRDLSITVEPPDKASAVFTVLLNATMNDGSRVDEVRELFCTFVKIEDHWLIDSMSVRDILEK